VGGGEPSLLESSRAPLLPLPQGEGEGCGGIASGTPPLPGSTGPASGVSREKGSPPHASLAQGRSAAGRSCLRNLRLWRLRWDLIWRRDEATPASSRLPLLWREREEAAGDRDRSWRSRAVPAERAVLDGLVCVPAAGRIAPRGYRGALHVASLVGSLGGDSHCGGPRVGLPSH